MSKHLTDSERLHIVEEYLGSPGASMPSRRSTTSSRGLLETIVRHFCDMTMVFSYVELTSIYKWAMNMEYHHPISNATALIYTPYSVSPRIRSA